MLRTCYNPAIFRSHNRICTLKFFLSYSAEGGTTQSAEGGTAYFAASDSTQVIAIVGLTSSLSATDKSRLSQWMKQRTNTPNLYLVFEKVRE